VKDKKRRQRTPQKKKQKKKKKKEKIQQLMKMENIFKQLPRLKWKPNNYKKCSTLVPPLLNKKSLWIRKDSQMNQLTQNQSSKRKTMDILKPLRKSKLEWQL